MGVSYEVSYALEFKISVFKTVVSLDLRGSSCSQIFLFLSFADETDVTC